MSTSEGPGCVAPGAKRARVAQPQTRSSGESGVVKGEGPPCWTRGKSWRKGERWGSGLHAEEDGIWQLLGFDEKENMNVLELDGDVSTSVPFSRAAIPQHLLGIGVKTHRGHQYPQRIKFLSRNSFIFVYNLPTSLLWTSNHL